MFDRILCGVVYSMCFGITRVVCCSVVWYSDVWFMMGMSSSLECTMCVNGHYWIILEI